MQAVSRDDVDAPAAAATMSHPRAGRFGGLPDSAPAVGPGDVTAVLVVHNGAAWLPKTLAALQALRRRPERVIAVDTGSTDPSQQVLRGSPVVDEILTVPASTTFGAAVAAAEALLATGTDTHPAAQAADAGTEVQGSSEATDAPFESTQWLWLLHDDSAPEPEALGALVAAAQRGGAAVAGPKVRGWHDQGLLVECGLSITNSGRRFTGIQVGDRDQGQRDDLTEVLAVGSAGMLVRSDLWAELEGFDPAVPMYGDDIEFCMRARRAGQRVVVVPQAVLHHREAATHGVRTGGAIARDPSVASRAAAMYTSLVHGPAWTLPITSVLLLLRTLVSALVLLLTEGPRRARDEVLVWGGIHLHPVRVSRARRRVRALAEVPRRDLRHLRPTFAEQVGGAFERWMIRLTEAVRPGRDRIEWGVGRALAIAGALAVIVLVATADIWMARGPLAGGALLPPVDGSTLWNGFRAAWHDVGLGSAEPAAPYPLALILLAALPVVSVDFVVATLLLFTVPLAAGSAYLALRGLPKPMVRAGLAVAYGLTPAAVVPALDGRLGTAAVAVLLPLLLRLLVRIYAPPGAELPAARIRTVAAAALVLCVTTAFAPLTWVAVAALAVIAAVVRRGRWVLWAWTAGLLLSPLVLLWPWSWSVVTDPSRLMFEAGVSSPQLVAAIPPTWRLLVLDPGTLGTDVTPVAAGLVAAACLGLLVSRSRSIAVWGWLVVAIGLLGATVQTSQQFLPLGATTAQYGFAGPMLHLMAAGMVLAAAGLACKVQAPTKAVTRAVTAAATLGLVAGPLVLAGLWITDFTGPLQRTDATVVPAFVTEQALSPAAVRTLLLDVDDSGAIGYALVNGAGGKLGDADVAPAAQTWTQLSAAVGGLAAGIGPAPVAVLADNAVQYVVASTDDEDLAAALDGNSALRRLSTTESEGLWMVEQPATRARMLGPQGDSPVGIVTDDAREQPGVYLDAQLDPAADSLLHIAQFNDGQWMVTVNGSGMAVADGQLVRIDLTGGPATVVVGRDQSSRDRALLVGLAGLLVLLVLLLPRGHLTGPPDPDAGDDEHPDGAPGGSDSASGDPT
jgi:GT2 family glycosyltransferase